MFGFIVTIHVIICVFLVTIVLLQQGKGAEAGAVFGGSEAIFGAAGPTTLLQKVTTALAIGFMVTSMGLTYLSAQKSNVSVIKNMPKEEQAQPTAAPESQGVDVKPLPMDTAAEKPASTQAQPNESSAKSTGEKPVAPVASQQAATDGTKTEKVNNK